MHQAPISIPAGRQAGDLCHSNLNGHHCHHLPSSQPQISTISSPVSVHLSHHHYVTLFCCGCPESDHQHSSYLSLTTDHPHHLPTPTNCPQSRGPIWVPLCSLPRLESSSSSSLPQSINLPRIQSPSPPPSCQRPCLSSISEESTEFSSYCCLKRGNSLDSPTTNSSLDPSPKKRVRFSLGELLQDMADDFSESRRDSDASSLGSSGLGSRRTSIGSNWSSKMHGLGAIGGGMGGGGSGTDSGIDEENVLQDLFILLPNGTTVSLDTFSPESTFREIKDEIFELASKGPMYGALRDPNSYAFWYVEDDTGSLKEVTNEECRLCDVQTAGRLLKLLEHKEDMASAEQDEQIGRLIGKSLKDFDALKQPEVNEFRYRFRSLSEEIVRIRQANSWMDKMKYAFPTQVDAALGSDIPKYLLTRMPPDGQILVRLTIDRPSCLMQMVAHYSSTPEELITAAIRQLASEEQHLDAYEELVAECEEESYYGTSFESNDPVQLILESNYFILKVAGCLEYLLGGHRLIQYRMIQSALLADETIHLVAVRRHSIEFEDESIYSVPEFVTPTGRARSQSVISLGALSNVIISTRRRPQVFSSWNIDRKLVIRIHQVGKFSYGSEIQRIAIMVGIFHGGELLCDHFITQPIALQSAVLTSKSTTNLTLIDPTNSLLNLELDCVFQLKVRDLPRMARLCFALVGYSSQSGSGKKTSKCGGGGGPIVPSAKLCWGNVNFFDYKGALKECCTTLNLWPVDPDEEADDGCFTDASKDWTTRCFNPLGTVVPNPAPDSPNLVMTFTKYSEGENSVIRYPELREICKLYPTTTNGGIPPESSSKLSSFKEEGSQEQEEEDAEPEDSLGPEDDDQIQRIHPEEEDHYEDQGPAPGHVLHRSASTSSTASLRSAWGRKQSQAIDKVDMADSSGPKLIRQKSGHASKQFMKQISDFCDRDLLYRMTEQECELLWLLREDCRRCLPNALNKLLLSFKWNNQKLIGAALSLLQGWPKLPAQKALELLDYAYSDAFVRKYAIECLREISNEELSQYLLQMVQALKYESYIYNDLVQFLLERALENQRIGHQLFWLLRSEMHNPAVSVTFGLILEAYCRGAVDHIHILSKQMDCLTRLRRINEIIRDDKSKENRDRKIAQMQDILSQKYYSEYLNNVINPLDPVYKLGALKVKRCKFMDSKMKPLWLVFENSDASAGDVYLIFKNGDDLRQDMLTLQMIRIMDAMWKEQGLDFRLSPYRCISVAHNVGLIEVVLNADTIANIQKERGGAAIAAFKKGSLFAWLRDQNPTEESLNRAVEEFTLSCAGYCVATYILGIADRHNDNIMVKRNGQLFHIDFGHILGKFKEKFGIRRERVPFVLTNDFVYVITHGNKKTSESKLYFDRFQQYCEEAFLIIRRNGNFIISLFAMMLSTGIPEVSSVDDLQYLRETLVLDLSEEQARVHFKGKFTEALKNSWKTSFNWCAHSLAKDNRMAE